MKKYLMKFIVCSLACLMVIGSLLPAGQIVLADDGELSGERQAIDNIDETINLSEDELQEEPKIPEIESESEPQDTDDLGIEILPDDQNQENLIDEEKFGEAELPLITDFPDESSDDNLIEETLEINTIEALSDTNLIEGTWGSCPFTLDENTGLLMVGAGTLGEFFNFPSSINKYSVIKIKLETGVKAPSHSLSLFADMFNLEEIEGRLDTSSVTIMGSMFSGCSSLKNLDVSSWDTSNVKHMSHMFNGCSNLTNLDVSSWDTSNVTEMTGMFQKSGVTNLDEIGRASCRERV